MIPILRFFKFLYFITVLLCFNYLSGQTVSNLEKEAILNQKITANQETLRIDPEKGFMELEALIEEAKKIKDEKAELFLLSSKYNYHYFRQIDFNKMFNAAKELQTKAKEYNSLKYQVIAYKYLANSYFFNELYDKSTEELENGLKLLEKTDNSRQDLVNERANIYTAYANVETSKKDYKSAINYLRLAATEHNKLTDPEQRRGTKFMDYSNLGTAFMQFDLDSASYYTNKSISLSLESEADHNLNFANYLTLGKVEKKRKDYEKALHFLNKADNIIDGKHFLNVKELYEELISVHEILGNQKEQQIYVNKLKDLELNVSQKQNTALQNLLKDKEKVDDTSKDKNTGIVIIGIGVLIIAGTIGYYLSRKKQKQPEKNINISPEDYKHLIELAKTNDTSFLLAFEKNYPEFGNKLQKINHEITDTEIDLLAMIKLKLTNKEIANYRFIQPKTVQNRRHRIRKKLNLSNSVDLDKWVEVL